MATQANQATVLHLVNKHAESTMPTWNVLKLL